MSALATTTDLPNQTEMNRNTDNDFPTTSNTNTNEPTETEPRTFSTAVKNQPSIKYPKRDQGIILDAIDNIKIKDYIYSVGNIVQPKNIIAASRISNSRICIYLSTKTLVDNFIQNHPQLEVLGHQISTRRLITPAKKIIISNISPTVPNYVIENTLKYYNIKPVSPIYLMKAGFTEATYSHIICFRRYVYAVFDDQQEETEIKKILTYLISINKYNSI